LHHLRAIAKIVLTFSNLGLSDRGINPFPRSLQCPPLSRSQPARRKPNPSQPPTSWHEDACAKRKAHEAKVVSKTLTGDKDLS
jgi:hypothetical protein